MRLQVSIEAEYQNRHENALATPRSSARPREAARTLVRGGACLLVAIGLLLGCRSSERAEISAVQGPAPPNVRSSAPGQAPGGAGAPARAPYTTYDFGTATPLGFSAAEAAQWIEGEYRAELQYEAGGSSPLNVAIEPNMENVPTYFPAAPSVATLGRRGQPLSGEDVLLLQAKFSFSTADERFREESIGTLEVHSARRMAARVEIQRQNVRGTVVDEFPPTVISEGGEEFPASLRWEVVLTDAGSSGKVTLFSSFELEKRVLGAWGQTELDR